MLDNTLSHRPFLSRTAMRHAYGVLTCLMLGQIATVAYAQSVTISSADRASSLVNSASTFERYEPFACAKILPRRFQGAGGVDVLSWRDRWPDTATARFVSTGEKQQPEILAEARACLAPVRVAAVRREQLIGLGIAYLGVDDTANARAAFERYLAEGAKQSVERRARDLMHVITAYSKADRVAESIAYLAKLDALGPAVAGFRLKAYNNFYYQVSGLDTIPLMDATVKGSRAAILDLQGDAQQQYFDDWKDAVFQAMDVEGRRGNFDGIQKLVQQTTVEWDRVRPGYAAMQFAVKDITTRVLQLGKTAPQMQAEYVFTPGKAEPATTPLPLPARGKLSVYFLVSAEILSGDEMGVHRRIWALRKKYPPSVLDIVAVASTSGIDWQEMRLLKTEDEVAKMREFFFDYMKLPVPLSVRVQPYTTNPIDGRRERAEFHDFYVEGGEILVDKNGIVRILRGGSRRLENMIEELK